MIDWLRNSVVGKSRETVVSIRRFRLAIILLLSCAGIWIVGSFGVWSMVKYHQGAARVHFVDLLLPSRWGLYRAELGDHYIESAGILLDRGEANAALIRLRAGVAKNPANKKGRGMLAQLFLANRRPDLAREVLLDGVRHLSGDPDYLQTTFTFLLEFQDDSKIQELAGQLLARPNAELRCTRIAATFAAYAAYFRGNYDRAEDLINQHRLRESADGSVLLARIEWERGYPELALLMLKDDIAGHPEHDAARAQLVAYFRSLGRTNEWESTVVERLVSDPLAAAPRIENLYLHEHRRDQPRLDRDAALYLEQFKHDPGALLLLADFAANTGRPALARRVQGLFDELKENSGAAALLVAESMVVAREYQPALDLIAEYTRHYPEWTDQFAAVFNGLQAVALCGLARTDEARLSLDHLLTGKNLRAENLLAVSNRLSVLGAKELARSTLKRAAEADPLNQAVLSNLIRLELECGALTDLPDHLHRFMRTRKPSRELLSVAYSTLGSDLHLYLPRQAELLGSLHVALTASHP
jgi:hypothetical protein